MNEVQRQVLYIRDVCAMLGATRDRVRGMIDRGELPKPFRLGRRLAWRRGDVEQAIDALAEQANRERMTA